MQLFDLFLDTYGTTGLVLLLAGVVLFVVQLAIYFRYGRLAGYKNAARKVIREEEPPVSVILPMFSEDYTFLEEQLPLLMSQRYTHYEVVIVYVGSDTDFHAELLRHRQFYPQLVVTRLYLDSRYPISRKMALNIGIKSAHSECMLFTSTDAVPRSDRWVALMAKGFSRGEIVIGYCALERKPGLWNRLFRTEQLLSSADWLSRAAIGRPHRGSLHNFGFTKGLYFRPEINGFNRLNMNIGEDDLFMQEVMTRDRVSVILSPKASVEQRMWSGVSWWISQLTYYGAARRFYPPRVRWTKRWEVISRLLFFAVIGCSIALMPLYFAIGAGVLLLLRYLFVLWEVNRIARRVGEQGICPLYFIYDLFSPLWEVIFGLLLLRKDERVWR